jgi:hypothetical protein
MTSLELSRWWGVDEDGPFTLMFGHIDSNQMRYTKLNEGAVNIANGICTYDSVSSFTVVENGDSTLIPDRSGTVVSYSVAAEVLSMTQGGKTIKAGLL